jgi:hypothetical protein
LSLNDYSTILDQIKILNLTIINFCCLIGNIKIDDQLKNDANIINLDTLNQTNYTKYLNLDFKYIDHNIELNYNDVYTSNKPIISYLNGIFKIENNLDIIIGDDGIYKVNANKVECLLIASYLLGFMTRSEGWTADADEAVKRWRRIVEIFRSDKLLKCGRKMEKSTLNR